MTARTTRLEPTEHEIMNLITNYLRYKGWYVMRLNSGVIPMTDSRGNQRRIMMGERGTPDLMAFRKPYVFDEKYRMVQLVFIEVKRPGNKPTWSQEQKMKELSEYGAKCLIATSIEDLEKEGI